MRVRLRTNKRRVHFRVPLFKIYPLVLIVVWALFFAVARPTKQIAEHEKKRNIFHIVNYHPPQAIKPKTKLELRDTNMKQRFQCLGKIRKRQEVVLRPLIGKPDLILLVDPAYHSNVGDHMITVSEQIFLHQYASVSECGYVQAGSQAPSCDEVIPSFPKVGNKVALWHGGGNWGDLWPSVHSARIKSFELLLSNNYTVIALPQSLHFQRQETQDKSTEQFHEYISKGFKAAAPDPSSHVPPSELMRKRVHLLWREHESFESASQLYPFVSHHLMPDTAFQLGPYASIRDTPALNVDILFLLRRDHESVHGDLRSRQKIRNLLDSLKPHLSFSIVDWPDRQDRFEDSDGKYFDKASVELLSLGKVVIVDRLHAAILAYQSGLDIVYVDPVSGKISKTLRLALESCPKDNRIVETPSLAEAVKSAVSMLGEQVPRGSSRIRPP